MDAKQNLFGLTLEQLKIVVRSLDLPAFTATQLADWLYKKHAGVIDDIGVALHLDE